MLVTKAQKSLLQEGIATQTGHNSEVFALAIAVAATIQFARPRWQSGADGQQTNWAIVGAVAAGWLALALGVYYLGFPPSIETLNEPFAAAALLTLYFGVPRPWRLSWVVPLATVLITLVTLQTAFVLNLSETVTSLVAVAISVDLVQRTILRPGARDAALLWLWWLFLALLARLDADAQAPGPAGLPRGRRRLHGTRSRGLLGGTASSACTSPCSTGSGARAAGTRASGSMIPVAAGGRYWV